MKKKNTIKAFFKLLFILTMAFMPLNESKACNANFTAYPDTISNCYVYFYNTSSGAASYLWDFGDGNTSTQTFPQYTYSASGTYNVILSTYDINGNWCDSTSVWVTVNCGGCNASFQYADSSCYVYFFASGASSYNWHFGDGTTGQGTNPVHYYSSNGSYYVSLGAYDSNGNLCDSIWQLVTVSSCNSSGCLPGFSAYPDTGSNCYVYFNNTSTGASSYLWDFGDGNTSTQTSPQYTYTASGTYNVILFAYDINGNWCDSISQWVTVNCGGCTADFIWNDTACHVGFYNYSFTPTNPIYFWDFGDGGTSSQENPTHTYSSSGTYQVSLMVWDSTCSDTIIKSVSINCVSGISDGERSSKLKIFPVPADRSFTVELNENIYSTYSLDILNMVGQTVYSTEIKQGKTNIQRGHLPSGVYMLHLSNGKHKETHKVIFK